LRITEEKTRGENAIITSFSRYAAEEGELLIVRPIGGPGVSPGGKFLEILALYCKILLKENP